MGLCLDAQFGVSRRKIDAPVLAPVAIDLPMKQLLWLLLMLLVVAQPAYPWSAEGHQAIAEAAKGMLTLEAKARIEKILGNDDLASASVWLDEIERIEITLPDLCDQNHTARVQTQLVKAAAHLGQLINLVNCK